MNKHEWQSAATFFLKAHGVRYFTATEVCDVGRERTVPGTEEVVYLEAPQAALMLNVVLLESRVLRWVRMERDPNPVRVNSWYRSPDYNMALGGASKSIHLTGAAADITKGRMTALELALWLHHEHPDSSQLGIGYYPSTPTMNEFVHVDVRGLIGRQAPARWPQSGEVAMWWE